MFKKYDQKRVVFEGAAGYNNLKENQFHGQVTKAKIVEFIQRHSLPLVVEFNHENAQKAFRGWVDSHLLIFAMHLLSSHKEKVDFNRNAFGF